MKTIGLIGNPNSGKTTLFNAITGANQHIGNWPGVTVEKKEGTFTLGGEKATLVDIPGIYSLTAASEDEKVSLEYVLSREASIFINVIDATNLERNLYLTLLLCELKVPIIVVVTMMDLAKIRGIEIDLDHLSKHLCVPVIGINANDSRDVKRLCGVLEEASKNPRVPKVSLEYPNELEQEIDILSSASIKTAEHFKVDPRWVALKMIEGDPMIRKALIDFHDMAPEVIDGAIDRCSSILGDSPDVVLADTRYGVIAGLTRDVLKITKCKRQWTEKIDKFVLNRFLGIPVFLGLMYIVFWITQVVGGAFIDFFDIAGDTIFISGCEHLLGKMNAPQWLIALLANGVGGAITTVGTFLPPVGCMFLCLAILEDSGYMSRAAFVMDRFMRWIGLPGKSFVPMLVGFGCSVPAIMATRTLESKRDRFVTIFMIPFMSCSAKLPVWVIFSLAFFPENPGKMIFLLYLAGIIIGIVTGLLMKSTLFQGEPTHFIMELPPYHLPRPKHIFLHTWERLKIFMLRAGKFIIPMVLVLGVLNTIGTDGSIGNEDSKNSVLSAAGKAITPIFEPIGVEKENWQASVAIFTGLFAKESVIGTLNGLYGQVDAKDVAEEEKAYSLIGGIKEAFCSIGENLGGIVSGIGDPLGFSTFKEDAVGDEAEEKESNEATIKSLRKHFSKGYHQAFAYLLFVLLYVPCLAATGVVFREIGKLYGAIFVGYLTVLGWSVSTIYHAVMVTQSLGCLSVGIGLIAAMFGGFYLYGRKNRIDMV